MASTPRLKGLARRSRISCLPIVDVTAITLGQGRLVARASPGESVRFSNDNLVVPTFSRCSREGGATEKQFTKRHRENSSEQQMKSTTIVLLLSFAVVHGALGQTSKSPAEQSIAAARRLINKNPKDFEAYNALALALS